MLSARKQHVKAFHNPVFSRLLGIAGPVEHSFFGDLFMPEYSSSLEDFFSDDTLEFSLDGVYDTPACSSNSEAEMCSAKSCTNHDLSSTKDDEAMSIDTTDKMSEAGSQLGKRLALSTSSVSSSTPLKKRSPAKLNTTTISTGITIAVPQMEDFEQQQAVRSKLVDQISKLIDRKQLQESDLHIFDEESLRLLSNFSYLIYKLTVNKAPSLTAAVSALNNAIASNTEKKKRNEERIKYVFKRVNKLLLEEYMSQKGMAPEAELVAMKQIIQQYFANGLVFEKVENMPGYERFFTLLFKPSNMYRNDLKEVFSYPAYATAFRDILEKDFLKDYEKERFSKIEGYLRSLKNSIYYSPDQSDPTILNNMLSRLPWSLAEVQKGISILSSVLKN